MAQASPTTEPKDELEDLLEASFHTRSSRLTARDLGVELAVSALVLGIAAALALSGSSAGQVSLVALVVVIAYGVASRVAYPLGSANLVITQPFLVLAFAIAPASYVPLMVVAGLIVGTLIEVLLGRTHVERASFAGGDAIHAIGPALVLVLTGHEAAGSASPAILVAAFAAQIAFDVISSLLRLWIASGVRPSLQLKAMGQIAAVDAALAPIGIVAAVALAESAWAAVALLPLVALVAFTARDRLGSVARAHARLVDLQRERARLRLAVQRIGDAFASNLDLDALLEIVTGAAVEALDCQSGEASTFHGAGRRLTPRATVPDGAGRTHALERAQYRALGQDGAVTGQDADLAVLAARITAGDETVATIAVARDGAPFGPEERELLAYLCQQAGVSAANVLRHEALHQQALSDELTGLANHRRFQEVLTAAVERHQRTGDPAALVLLDLDNFKAINDTYGHQTGDAVLRAVGRCLLQECRVADEPARYGGEELAVVLDGTDLQVAAQRAERIRQAVEQLVVLAPDGQRLPITVSAGVAALEDGNGAKKDLVAAADTALYQAKRNGKNRIECAWTLGISGDETASILGGRNRGPRSRATPEADLRAGLADGEFVLHYQPLLQLPEEEVTAVEALVRWRHPQRGLLAPSEFVPLAEECGLIVPLGAWVLREACRQGTEWVGRWPELKMSVNVSAEEIAQRGFVSGIRTILQTTGMPAANLILEVTETRQISNLPQATLRLQALRELGIQIAADDFGTGYSNLQHLLELPLDILKVPRTFIERLDQDEPDPAISESILTIARRYHLTVVAEGIERPAQLERLKSLGCDIAQGFLLGRPLDASEIELGFAGPPSRVPRMVTV